jgi:hypothetical protein
MDDRAAMRVALGALESNNTMEKLMAAKVLRERLAQPKQEPVDCVTKYDMIRYFELIADAIEKNDSDSLRHEAWCLTQDMK